MINYIGQSQKEKSNSIIRVKIKKQKSFFTLLLLALPLIFLLFDYGYIDSPEKITGDRKATCQLLHPSGTSSGTAFLASKNGLLITARHCVDDLALGELVTLNFDKIKLPGYHNLKAELVYLPSDENDDFAVLKFIKKHDNIEPLKIAGNIEDPEMYNPEVIIIGYPDNSQTYDNTNAVRNYTLEDSTLFLTNEIFKGMSGGPVIDKKTGEVIGIVSKKILLLGEDRTGSTILQDQEGLSKHEKIQQVFEMTPHLNW
jgi:S1-C subfamily serine protease